MTSSIIRQLEADDVRALPRFAALAVATRATRRLQPICPRWAEESLATISLLGESVARFGIADSGDSRNVSMQLRQSGERLLEEARRHGVSQAAVESAEETRLAGVSALCGLAICGADVAAGHAPERGLDTILAASDRLHVPELFRLIRRDTYCLHYLRKRGELAENTPVGIEECGPLWQGAPPESIRRALVEAAIGGP